MSLVALEAGALGLPVLLTDTCGFDEIAQIGGGIVVQPNADSIADGLTKMLSNKNDFPKMGIALKTFVQENYDWESIVENLNSNLKFFIGNYL